MEPQVTKVTQGPVETTFSVWSDGSVGLDMEFTNAEYKLAQLFVLDMEAAQAAAAAVTEALTSAAPAEFELCYETSEHHSIEEDAMLSVHDADGPEGWLYKIVDYPPDEGRWGLARIYVFGTNKRGPCPMEGRVRNVALAKCLADAMARHWRK